VFSFLTKRNFHGNKELDRFKQLMSKRAVFEATVMQSTTGRSGIQWAVEVQEAVNLCYSLTSMTSLNDVQLLDAVRRGKWSELERLLSKYGDAIDAFKMRKHDELKSLIKWADRNNVPERQSFDAMVYKETGLPRTEDELASLRFVHIPGANLHEIPKELAVLPMVMAVCLSENKIRTIPPEIFNMPSVYRLDLEDNDIEEIPGQISQMSQLQSLDLDRNNLKSIPKSLRSMSSLKKFFVRGQKHGAGLLSPSTPLSDEEVEVLDFLSFRDDFELRT
jgi:hypothetical protein